VRAMHSNELTRIQLGGQLGQRFTHQVHLAARVYLDVIAGRR
jgi:predicted phage tail protein